MNNNRITLIMKLSLNDFYSSKAARNFYESDWRIINYLMYIIIKVLNKA